MLHTLLGIDPSSVEKKLSVNRYNFYPFKSSKKVHPVCYTRNESLFIRVGVSC